MTDTKPRSWEDIIGNGISRDRAPFRVVVKNTYGEEFCDAYLELDSIDEVLADEETQGHIKIAYEATLSEFTSRLDSLTDLERANFREENLAIQKRHKQRRKRGYDRPELYERLNLPSVMVNIYKPGSWYSAHNTTYPVGWELLDMEPDF